MFAPERPALSEEEQAKRDKVFQKYMTDLQGGILERLGRIKLPIIRMRSPMEKFLLDYKYLPRWLKPWALVGWSFRHPVLLYRCLSPKQKRLRYIPFPTLLAKDIVDSQPMSLPASQIFYMDYVFKPDTGEFAPADSAYQTAKLQEAIDEIKIQARAQSEEHKQLALKIRDQYGFGILDVKKALEANEWGEEKAIAHLKRLPRDPAMITRRHMKIGTAMGQRDE